MRNPDRIDEVLKVLGDIWKSNPDLRLAQIISNSLVKEFIDNTLFYIEDDLLLERLIEFKSFVEKQK